MHPKSMRSCAPAITKKKKEANVDWKLMFELSLFGLAMAIATVFVIPSNIEPVFWLVIFLLCAFLIARSRPNRHFLHGLLGGIVNSVWVTTRTMCSFLVHRESSQRGSHDGLHAAAQFAALDDGLCRPNRG